ncbi:MAG: efflux RND transporter periplasmic adaptor subunit [Gemmatimonadota bacterium]
MHRYTLLITLMLAASVLGCGAADPVPVWDSSEADSLVPRAERSDHEGKDTEDHARYQVIELDPVQVEVVRLETAQASVRAFHPKIRTTGEVKLNEARTVHIVSKVSGWIERLDAFLRDEVRAGQRLALNFSPDYLTARTELVQAHRRLERARQTDDTEALRIAEAILESARKKLLILGAPAEPFYGTVPTYRTDVNFELRTPISGTVVETEAGQGNAIEPGDPLFRISNLTELWVSVDVYEDDLRFVKQGDSVTLTVKAYPGENFRGRITQLGALLDPKTRTVKARAVVGNRDRRLKPGMFAGVAIETRAGAEEAVGVPTSAVQHLDDRAVVFVVDGESRFSPREVTPGAEEDGFTRIERGLEPGETVVTEGSFFLKAELLKESFGEGH